jgi:hypothetical protein
MLWVQRCDRVLPVGDDLADVHGGHAARRGAATSHGGWPDQARRGLRPHRRSGAVLPDLRDVVITANALPCQRAHAEHLRARGAHYLFSPSRPTSRRCARRWSGCPGRRCPDCCIALSATAGSSRAPSRSSTWTGRRRPGCSRTGPGQSRSSADAAAPARSSHRWRRCTPAPPWTTATPTRGCWPAGTARTGRSRTVCTGSAT